MDSRKVIEYVFFAVVSTLGSICVYYTHNISQAIEEIGRSITLLNIRSETQGVKMFQLEEASKDHEQRIRKIELHEKR